MRARVIATSWKARQGTTPHMLQIVVLAAAMRTPVPRMNLMSSIKNMMGGSAPFSTTFTSRAPKWDALKAALHSASTEEERNFRAELESGRASRACALAKKRLFDLPDGDEPRVTLFRDTAAWCPYCEKVWLTLEEKRVPYKIEKVNMNCYGQKPASFLAMQPSGGIPVAKLDGAVIRESNDIISDIEAAFPERPLVPPASDPARARVPQLLQLERQLFGAWFRWLGGGNHGAQLVNFEAILAEVEAELGEGGGP